MNTASANAPHHVEGVVETALRSNVVAAALAAASRGLHGRGSLGVVRVPLTKGYVALIDECDAERVLAIRWRALVAKPGFVYGYQTTVGLMHRFILCVPAGMDVDHANHDTLDNRRSNLRRCSRAQNHCNRRAWGRVGLKGVTLGRRGRFVAKIGGRHLGTFRAPEDAARAYDAAALDRYGEFALTNAAMGLLR